jgi:predicted nucleic-acid-binding protein
VIGIDTNVLVRFLTRDDENQYELARSLIQSRLDAGEALLVSLLVVMETEWVLRSRYGSTKPRIIEVLTGLLESRETVFEDESSLEEALFSWRESNADFADCLIVARGRRLGCRKVVSFDAKAARLPGGERLEAP